LGPLSWPWRVVLFCSSPLLIAPEPITDLVGVVGVAVVLGYQLWRNKLSGRAAAALQ
jgi:TRAP-type uncharacterized transport system fused permease subunit